MSQTISTVGTGIAVDATNTASAIVLRDAQGNISVTEAACVGIKNTAHTKLGYTSQAASVTIDNATYDATIYDMDCTSGAKSLVLPTAASVNGQIIHATKIDSSANALTVDGFGTETINGALTVLLRQQYDSLEIYSDGTNWKVRSFTSGTVSLGSARTAIPDPGNAGAIAVNQSGYVPLVSAGAETRTLAIPTFIGQELSLYCKTFVGNIVVTVASAYDASAHTTITLNTVRDSVLLRAIENGSAKAWALVYNDGCALA